MRVFIALAILGTMLGLPMAQDAAHGAESKPTPYHIGIDDVLHLVVWGENGLDLTLRVRPDGFISLPLVKDVEAAGRTPGELSSHISTLLSTYMRDPDVTVMVEEINSFKIYVLGRVTNQGVFTFSEAPGLLQVLAAAGGLTEFSSEDVTVIRKKGSNEERFRVDLKKIFNARTGAKNIYLEPGDVVLVN